MWEKQTKLKRLSVCAQRNATIGFSVYHGLILSPDLLQEISTSRHWLLVRMTFIALIHDLKLYIKQLVCISYLQIYYKKISTSRHWLLVRMTFIAHFHDLKLYIKQLVSI
jgi:hypothetical protein